jgi:redox-sensitive bicupin YhaK (pirin superfamily)
VSDETVDAAACVALGATGRQLESYPRRDMTLGPLTATRVLPVKGKRLIGPWCFLDRFGPLTFANPSPMPETILMWWNFVARTPVEIAEARRDWEERRRFGDVSGYNGTRLDAPSLVSFASANPVS